MTDEVHHTRHKDILVLIRKIEKLDNAEQTTDTHSTKHTKPERSCEETEMSGLRKRERKKAKKLGSKTHQNDMDIFRQEDIDHISEALHQSIHGTKAGRAGWNTYESPRARLGTNDGRVLEEGGEDAAEGAGHNHAVHAPRFPTTKQKNATNAAKRAPNTAQFTQAKLRGNSRKYDPNAAKSHDPHRSVHPAVFYRLGININNPTTNSSERRLLVCKLAAAIKDDLEVVTKEQEEAAMREEGFWRWAGRGAYENMMDYHEIFDWATGAKIIPKGEEEVARAEADDDGDLDTGLEDEENDVLGGVAQTEQPVASEEVKGVDNKAIDTSNNGKERTTDTEMRVREDSNVPDTTLYDVSTLFRSLAEISSVSSLARLL
ncbi:SAM-dependent methyltransferase -type protein [Rutstroemia sp. NJR-2017a BBW]|nr:SAM-dependent methyltransferase -type protein [Rutstroemia sp. NJR-2017a BBW]